MSCRQKSIAWHLKIFLSLWLIPCALVLLEIRYIAGISLTTTFITKALGTFFPVALSGMSLIIVINTAKHKTRQ